MEAGDVVRGVLQLVDDLLVELLVGGVDLVAGDLQVLELHLVELLGELDERLVSLGLDLFDDALDDVLDLVGLVLPVADPVLFADLLPLLGFNEFLGFCILGHDRLYTPQVLICSPARVSARMYRLSGRMPQKCCETECARHPKIPDIGVLRPDRGGTHNPYNKKSPCRAQ